MRDATILITSLTISIFLFAALALVSDDNSEAVIRLSDDQIIELYRTK